jgi:hypothetical protein
MSVRATRFAPSAAILAAAVVLAACGGGDTSPDASQPASAAPSTAPSTAPEVSAAASAEATPGTTLTACEIVTAEDVTAVLADLSGETITITPGESRETPTVLDPFGTECRYTGEWGGVIVSLTPADGANLYDAARGSYADAQDVETPGADSAFWSEDNSRAFFWKGSVNVMLQIGFLAVEADRAEVIKAIGAAAIAKL